MGLGGYSGNSCHWQPGRWWMGRQEDMGRPQEGKLAFAGRLAWPTDSGFGSGLVHSNARAVTKDHARPDIGRIALSTERIGIGEAELWR
eukprot:6197658-Pleurochrysis_carterae.AAC.1